MASGSRTFRTTLLIAVIWALTAAGPARAQPPRPNPAGGAEEVALPFSAKTLAGEPAALDSLLREKRFLVMTFWGINCSPCIKEIASLNAMWANPAFRERAGMLAVNTDKIGPKRLVAEMKKKQIEIAFPIVADEGYEITNAYVNGMIPLTVLIDRDRRIRMSILGADAEELALMEKIVLAGKGAGQ